jgi:hypothetical protein
MLRQGCGAVSTTASKSVTVGTVGTKSIASVAWLSREGIRTFFATTERSTLKQEEQRRYGAWLPCDGLRELGL